MVRSIRLASDNNHLKNLVSYHAVEPWRRRVGPELHARLSKLNEVELAERAMRAAATEEQLAEAKSNESDRPFECFSAKDLFKFNPDEAVAKMPTSYLEKGLKMFSELQSDGYIHANDFLSAVEKICGEISQVELQEMLADAEKDGGNRIDEGEFTQLFAEARLRHQAGLQTETHAAKSPHHRNLIDLVTKDPPIPKAEGPLVHSTCALSTHRRSWVFQVMHLELSAQEHKHSELAHLPVGQSAHLDAKIGELEVGSQGEQEASRQIRGSRGGSPRPDPNSSPPPIQKFEFFADFEYFWCDCLPPGAHCGRLLLPPLRAAEMASGRP